MKGQQVLASTSRCRAHPPISRTTPRPALRRPQATREDFLRYLQLELNFESLLKCRRKRMGITKQGGADFAIRRRVHFIFSRALNRFKGDEMLWLQWIDFAQRRKSDKRLERIFGRALAVLPRSAELWTRAAAWELEVRANSTAARRLLQRALHVNRRERGLWLAYFRFELIFGEKTRRRREMLGVGVGGSGAQEGERQGESGREASAGGGEGGLESGSAGEEEASSEEEESGDVDAEGDAEGGEEGDEEGGEEGDAERGEEVSEEVAKAGAGARAAGGATGPVCTGDPTSGMQSSPGMPPWCAIAHVVFNEATAALGPDAPFHLGCLRTCAEFESAAPLARLVEASTRRGFAADPEVAASLASFPLDGCPVGGWTAAHTAAVLDGLRSLESSVAASPTEPVWDACGVWTEQMMRREEVPPGLAARLRKQAIRLSKDAHKARVASAAVYLRWALLTLIHSPAVLRSLPPLAQVACSPQAWRELLSACSAAAESAAAAQAALRICETGVKLHPHDAPLACLCLQLTMTQRGGCTRLRDLAAVREAFWTAARSVADSPGAIPVWRLWVESALGAADAGSNPETALEVWKLAAANLKHQSAQLKVGARVAGIPWAIIPRAYKWEGGAPALSAEQGGRMGACGRTNGRACLPSVRSADPRPRTAGDGRSVDLLNVRLGSRAGASCASAAATAHAPRSLRGDALSGGRGPGWT